MFSDNESCIKGCIEQNVDNYQQMKSVVPAYINKRDCNIQEFIYHILAGQWLRKTCPGVIFANSNLPKKKRYQICRDEKIYQNCQKIQQTFLKGI